MKAKHKTGLRKLGKHPKYMYGVLAMAVMVAAFAAVQLIPSDSYEDTSATITTDFTIDLSSTDNLMGTGYGFNASTGALTFSSDANNFKYTIIQSGPHKNANIAFGLNVTTTVVIDGINITGNSIGTGPPIGITLGNGANATILLHGSSTITGSVVVPSTATLTINNSDNNGGSDGSLNVTVPNLSNAAAIGGNVGQATGNINIMGGTVTATNIGPGSYGAAIGGGGGNNAVGGGGGSITIGGNAVVTATSGNGAAIGGGSSSSSNYANGQGTALTIYSTATVNASSWCMYYHGGTGNANLPAIHARSIAGDGYFVNATVQLTNFIPQAFQNQPYNLRVFADGDMTNALATMRVDNQNWKSFAFQIPGSNAAFYNVYAEFIGAGGTTVFDVLRAIDNSPQIPTINASSASPMSSYNIYAWDDSTPVPPNKTGNNDAVLPVKMGTGTTSFASVTEKYIYVDSGVEFQTENIRILATGSNYNVTAPAIAGYLNKGHIWNNPPTDRYDPLINPSNQATLSNISGNHVVYFLYAVEVPYVDVNGNTQVVEALPIDKAYIDSKGGVLTGSGGVDGWYFIKDTFSLSQAITINGDVKIIIGDGYTIYSSGLATGIVVQPGSRLSFYSQPIVDGMGMLSSNRNGVTLNAGSELINTALIASTYGGYYAVNSTAGGDITVGMTGIIRAVTYGILHGNGTVNNYNVIQGTGPASSGIRAEGAGELFNHSSGYITGTLSGVRLSQGSLGFKVDNFGMIEANDGTSTSTIGLWADGTQNLTTTIINRAGATIKGTGYGISSGTPLTINNFGTIESFLSGAGSAAVSFGNGGTITNEITGTIVGVTNGITVTSGATTFKNFNAVTGSVTLANANNNDIEFGAGSLITGNFAMGMYTGKLHFSGSLASPFIYSTVTGSATGNAAVSFEDGDIIGHTNQTIVLIDASSMTMSLSNNMFTGDPPGNKSYRILVSGSQLTAVSLVGENYVDVDGTLQTHASVTRINQSYFSTMDGNLTGYNTVDGWYFVE
ncbi:MAG: hypothetical protein FWH45_00190, partial [Methanomassiliicoccaceae archaeon]|nr:hypothetical protein [Methanomassiliicoccaceae archaeon]